MFSSSGFKILGVFLSPIVSGMKYDLTDKRLSSFTARSACQKNMKTMYVKVLNNLAFKEIYICECLLYKFHKTKFSVQTLHKCLEVNMK